MEIEGKPNQSMAVTQCALNGIGISGNEFRKLVHEYNNYEMPISQRIKLIAEDKDQSFYEFVKLKTTRI